MSTKILYNIFVSCFDLCKEYKICLISFLSFSELFRAFNRAKQIGNLPNIWLYVSILSPSPSWFLLLRSRILSTISIIFLFSSVYNNGSFLGTFLTTFFIFSVLLIEFTWFLFTSLLASLNLLIMLLGLEWLK